MKQPKFVSGPPGTGKTHLFLIEKYKELLKTLHSRKNNNVITYKCSCR